LEIHTAASISNTSVC